MTDIVTFESLVPFTLQAFTLSDKGRVRPSNEDRSLMDLENNLFMLCDGIGEHAAGQIAAQAVVEFLPRSILHKLPIDESVTPEEIVTGLIETVQQSSRQLLEASTEQTGMKGMGTTLALVWVRGATAYLVNIGDSRIYLVRENQLKQMTEDHSFVALMVKSGDIRPELARAHPAHGRLSRYMGMEDDGTLNAGTPDVHTLELCKGDRLLMCSDGLTDMVPDEEIAAVLHVNPSPASACRALIGLANAHGGKDNITALVINVIISQD